MNPQSNLDITIGSDTYRFSVSEPSMAATAPNTVLVVSERTPHHGQLGTIFTHKYVAVGDGRLSFDSVFPVANITVDHAVLSSMVEDIVQRKAVVRYFMDYIAEAKQAAQSNTRNKSEQNAGGNGS